MGRRTFLKQEYSLGRSQLLVRLLKQDGTDQALTSTSVSHLVILVCLVCHSARLEVTLIMLT